MKFTQIHVETILNHFFLAVLARLGMVSAAYRHNFTNGSNVDPKILRHGGIPQNNMGLPENVGLIFPMK